MSKQQPIVDYQEAFPHALMAQGTGRDFFALFSLGETIRHKGKNARYELLHRWLREPCLDEDDQSWSLVMGTKRTYLPTSEAEPLLRKIRSDQDVITDLVNLF